MSNNGMDTFKVGGENIVVVQYFNLLRSIIEADGGCQREVARILAIGTAAMSGLEKIWKDKGLSVNKKSKSVKTLVFPDLGF